MEHANTPEAARRSSIPGSPQESLLILSDVHLGSDLHEQAQRTGVGRRTVRIDRDLVNLLRHYRGVKPPAERWRLVINGDFIDFIGMAIPSEGERLETEPNPEERAHGLGNSEDHARIKLSKVAERHPEVFTELAGFVADGHALSIVHGNHDLEFHWEAVRRDFLRLLSASAPNLPAEALAARVEFQPWFLYVRGLAYIEHGHQYDPFCATDHVMAPLSPLDPRRMARGFCDVLLRYVVRPTRGLKAWGHDHLGIPDYLRMGFRLGLRGMFTLGVRFAVAVVELFRLRREHFAEAADTLRREHERRVALLAEASRIGAERIRALLALQEPPITRSIRGILASVLLDRLALGLGALLTLGVAGLVAVYHSKGWYALPVILVLWALFHRHLTRQRHVDPSQGQVDRASKLALLFRAAVVVMGHTHIPVFVPVNNGQCTFVNLGSWAEEEDPGEAQSHQAARTHLVIHPASGPEVRFLQWDSETGPREFQVPAKPFTG